MPLCIFCDQELKSTTTPEHVLLSALGGRKTTRSAICDFHNNRFGGTIDKALTDQVPVIRNFLQFPSGTGKPPPSLRNIQARGEVLNILSDGRPELVGKPFEVTKLADGTFNLSISARSEEEFAALVPRIAAHLDMPEESLWEQLENAEGHVVYRRANPILFKFPLGGPESIRSIAKSCLVLAATMVGTAPLREEAYAEVRGFITESDEAFNRKRTSLDARALPDHELLVSRFGPFFNLIYVKSDARGRMIGHFTLYNLIAWQVMLADCGGPPNLRIGLGSNPLNPTVWSDEIADVIDLDFEWLASPNYANIEERTQQRFVALMQHYQRATEEREVGRIIDGVLRRRLPSDPDVALSEAETQTAIAEAVNRVGHMLANVPLTEAFRAKSPNAE